MNVDLNAEILAELCVITGLPVPEREKLRVRRMSGVERLIFPDCGTAIYEYACGPFAGGDQVLRMADMRGIPVPKIYASVFRNGWLGMLLEDLGTPSREADERDAVTSAVALHSAVPSALPVLAEDTLQLLPHLALSHLDRLRNADRWMGTYDIENRLRLIADAASSRTEGTHKAPFGWMHSEFHPESLHIGEYGWRFLDLARAFTGPGLLDLAGWYGTDNLPDATRLRSFIECYVAAGGHQNALAERGGLSCEAWALGWHRVWTVEWLMEQAVRWINDPDNDVACMKTVHRHLESAVLFLEI